MYHHTYLDKVLTECLQTWRLGRWYARARKRPSFCATWAYEPSANGPDVHAESKWCKVSAPLMSSGPPGGGQGWETEAREGVAKLAFTEECSHSL